MELDGNARDGFTGSYRNGLRGQAALRGASSVILKKMQV
jgi:hypothetical protein